MSKRRRRKPLPEGLFATEVTGMSHDGRGIAHIDGKVTFIDGALPNEKVKFKYTYQRKKLDEGKVIEIEQASEDRVEPKCEAAMICGGCSLQHLSADKQREFKQSVMLEQFEHIAEKKVETVFPPIFSDAYAYRRKARLAVRYVHKKGKVLVGFREKRNSFVADVNQCEVLVKEVGMRFTEFSDLVESLEIKSEIPQIEIAKGDENAALVFRHLAPIGEDDLNRLKTFCLEKEFELYLQSGGPSTIKKVILDNNKAEDRLSFEFPNMGLKYKFHPSDFLQVNGKMNELMVEQAVALLQVKDTDEVLDLFCGLGNFSLPLANKCHQLVGVEGSQEMVLRAEENASLNEIKNARFYALDLFTNLKEVSKTEHPWLSHNFNKLLIDPPRSGALEVAENINLFSPEKIVYVSCNPATLARDAKVLLENGYELEGAGVVDMFPHTNHIESIAVFNRCK